MKLILWKSMLSKDHRDGKYRILSIFYEKKSNKTNQREFLIRNTDKWGALALLSSPNLKWSKSNTLKRCHTARVQKSKGKWGRNLHKSTMCPNDKDQVNSSQREIHKYNLEDQLLPSFSQSPYEEWLSKTPNLHFCGT